MYRQCTRNFSNLLDEIEKVDYNFDVENDHESSDEEEMQNDDALPQIGEKMKPNLQVEKKIDEKITVFSGCFQHLNDIDEIMINDGSGTARLGDFTRVSRIQENQIKQLKKLPVVVMPEICK